MQFRNYDFWKKKKKKKKKKNELGFDIKHDFWFWHVDQLMNVFFSLSLLLLRTMQLLLEKDLFTFTDHAIIIRKRRKRKGKRKRRRRKLRSFRNHRRHSKYLLLELTVQMYWKSTYLNRYVRNVPSDVCSQQKLKSTQSDQSLRCPHEETFHHWISKCAQCRFWQPECAGCPESSLMSEGTFPGVEAYLEGDSVDGIVYM